MGIGENRHATHRNQRWYDLTERAYEYSRGPMMYHDLMTYERLDRPQVRVFQRHPGTQLKEPQEIVRVCLYKCGRLECLCTRGRPAILGGGQLSEIGK